MKLGNKILAIVLLLGTTQVATAQTVKAKFGKGIVIEGENYKMKAAFRFQSLFINEWDVRNDDFNYVEGLKSNFLIRRARLKFNGWAYSPKIKYKFEVGLSNRDITGGDSPEYKNASRLILDAYVEYNFFQNFSILIGQTKLPGNRERVLSSANMQFVNRSRLNSRFNLDRDMGAMLKHKASIGANMKIKTIYSFAQGAGRNVTAGNLGGGFSHTLKVEAFPFGDFASKGAYIGGDINREQKPKLAIAAAYNINTNAVRERGQLGNFIIDANGNYLGKTINTLYADLMFKYKGLSVMAEFAQRETTDGSPNVLDENDNTVGTYYTGSALNLQAGYLLKSNYEFSGRYTIVTPETATGKDSENEYAIALSKYVVGHKLKIQTDLGYRQLSNVNAKDDKLFWRVQVDIHF